MHDYIGDGTRITGIRGRGRAGGALVTERATMTIGADGRNSRLARTVIPSTYEATPPLTCWYFSYWSGAPGDCHPERSEGGMTRRMSASLRSG
ncbi:MAG: hypothetical protein H0T50_11090 [Gemmatimonadales bacterium]|nr:hypothetical protein [Gemmatimonadales bacterium]